MKLFDDIKRLVEWYEKNKPDAGQRIEVSATPEQLAKALDRFTPDMKGRRDIPSIQNYRGRTIVATRSGSSSHG